MTEQDHVQEAFRFLQRARLFTAEEDRLARSEMLWCAAAHIVKAIAVQQGWRNRSHRDLFEVAGKINSVIAYPDAYFHFSAAGRLHKNMYQGFMTDRELGIAAGIVAGFVNRIAAAI